MSENDKDATLRKLQKELDHWQAELDRMKRTNTQNDPALKSELDKLIERLDRESGRAAQMLSAAKESAGQSFEDVRAGLESAWREIRHAFGSAVSRFDNPGDA